MVRRRDGGEPQLVLNDAAPAAVSPDGRHLSIPPRPRWESKPLDHQHRQRWIRKSIGRRHFQKHLACPRPRVSARMARRLAFWSDGRKAGSYTSELWIVPYPTGAPRRVLERIPECRRQSYELGGDNRYIVWNSAFPDRLGRSSVSGRYRERSTIHPITSGTVNELSPSVSPGGDTIAFASGSDDFDLIQCSFGWISRSNFCSRVLAAKRGRHGRRQVVSSVTSPMRAAPRRSGHGASKRVGQAPLSNAIQRTCRLAESAKNRAFRPTARK